MTSRLAKFCTAWAILASTPVLAITRYVDLSNPNPAPPYTSWATAATNIQQAVDACISGDEVLVTNGVYQTGGRVGYGALTNRVAVDRSIWLRSVNGPLATVIQGFQIPASTNGDAAVRCVYLTNGARLTGFKLTGGATRKSGNSVYECSGGGVLCESTSATVSNCVITGNASGYGGGGAYSGTLTKCLITTNSVLDGRAWGGGTWASAVNDSTIAYNVADIGGGVYEGLVKNCLLMGNSAVLGGGIGSGTAVNCTIVNNFATYSGGGASGGTADTFLRNCIIFNNAAPLTTNYSGCTLSFCCTTPLPAGNGNIGNTPQFVNLAAGDLHLQASSPCINAGHNAFVTSPTDFDGNQRITGGTVDIGAYEFQSPSSALSYAWAQRNGLPTDVSADYADTDGDGHNNWQEWQADTVPTNAASILKLLAPAKVAGGISISWQSTTTRSYWLERLTHFGGAVPFQTVATNIAGVTGVKSFTDLTATNAGPYFYRVGVQP